MYNARIERKLLQKYEFSGYMKIRWLIHCYQPSLFEKIKLFFRKSCPVKNYQLTQLCNSKSQASQNCKRL